MWRGNRDYLLRLRIFVLGRTEKVVLRRHAEGSACSWTSSTPWLRDQSTEQWRRNKCRYRDFSRRNASTAWRTISIFRKILSFFFDVRISHLISFFFQISFGSFHYPAVPEYVDELLEGLIAKKAPFVRWLLLLLFTQYFMILAC